MFDRKIVYSEVCPIILLGILASTCLWFDLSTFPSQINPDALDTLNKYFFFKTDPLMYIFAPNWNGASSFNTYVIGLGWEYLGQNVLAFRSVIAFIALCTTLSLYIFLRLFNVPRLFSWIGSAVLITTPWYLNFARDPWENILNGFFLIILLIGLHQYIKIQKLTLFSGIMIVSGAVLGFYAYHPGKIFSVIAVIVPLSFFIRKLKTSFLMDSLLLGAIILLFITPLLVGFYLYPIDYFGRINNVSIFQQPDPLNLLFDNLVGFVQGFFFLKGEAFNYSRYVPPDVSIIAPWLIYFYMIGLFWFLYDYPILLFATLLAIVPVQLLSNATPDGARGVHWMPMIAFYTAYGAWKIFEFIQRKIPKLGLLRFVFLLLFITNIPWGISNYIRWMSDPRTITVRMPAVKVEQFENWHVTQRSLMKERGSGTNVQEYLDQYTVKAE